MDSILIKKEITASSILSRSGIPGTDYCINPYVGCVHGCRYCYATFMKRFTGHTEQWGKFLDIKINAPEVLKRQLKRAKKGGIIISSVTDAYQPIEVKYKLTKGCLEALVEYQFPASILTKSPLVLRDIDLFKRFEDIEIGITITTDNDSIRKIFEPNAPPIGARLNALKTLHENGIKTYAFIGPVLPMNPERLVESIRPYSHRILIDRMNYISKTRSIYKDNNLDKWFDERFVDSVIDRIQKGFSSQEITLC